MLDAASEDGAKGVGIDGLEEVVVRSLPQGRDRSVQVGVAGDDEDRSVGGERPNLGEVIVRVSVGQPAVDEDRHQRVAFAPLEGLAQRAGELDPVVVQLQDVPEVRSGVRIVLDYENGLGVSHAPDSASSSEAAARGRVTVNVAPLPGSLATRIPPPCFSTMARVIASPRPMPRAFVV